MMNRRRLLQLGAGQIVLATTPWQTAFAQTSFAKQNLAICQLATNENSTVIRVIHDKNQSLTFQIKDPNEKARIKTIETGSTDYQMMVSLIFIEDLSLNTTYEFLAFVGDEQIDKRQFRALDTNKENYRFVLGSCMADVLQDNGVWKQMEKEQPDFIVFVGDAVYADLERNGSGIEDSNPSTMFRRFCESLSGLPNSHWPMLVPHFATWDDHDFGKNDSGIEFKYVKEAQDNFELFFAIDEDQNQFIERGPGVSKSFIMGDVRFMLMDCRSFRQKREVDERFSHWGEEQEAWLYSSLSQHGGPTWIMSGSQMFPGRSRSESLSYDHKKNFAGLLSELKQSQSRCLFASGDVHHSDLSKIYEDELGYSSREITSSSIHSRTFPGLDIILSNQRRIASTWRQNFVLIESSTKSGDLDVMFRSVGKSGRKNFSRDFSLSL